MRNIVVAITIILQAIGLYLFKTGFLLERLDLPDINTRPTVARYNKTVLVMIDALRYDFMRFQQDIKNPPHFMNKMTIIKEKLLKEPRNSLLFRGFADPPTTTLQRLLAIVTGALPTLVDAGSNFQSTLLKQDNLIQKLIEKDKKIVILGDDTWDRLFPSSVNESHYYPSFDVWDLHTVDTNVKRHLFPMLKQDFGLLIAHFLGVDHAGHRYGPGHVAMGSKLVEMDMVLRMVFESVDEQTLVVVIGDHGMDSKGDHGGDSFQEMNAGLFFYSKTEFIRDLVESKQRLDKIMKKILELGPDYDIFSVFDGDRTVQQIDLVPTWASLMGIPIPFGNLGSIIPEFFMESDKTLIESIHDNAIQVHDYLQKYCDVRSDAKQMFSKSRTIFSTCLDSITAVRKSNYTDGVIDSYVQHIHFLRHTLLVARNIWSRFEPTLMAMGIIIQVFAVIFFVVASLYDVKVTFVSLFGLLLGVFGFFSPISVYYYPNSEMDTLAIKMSHEAIFFSCIGFLITLFLFSARDEITFRHFEYIDIPSVLLLVCYIGSIGSDSFIIFEDFMILHFIQFLHGVLLLQFWYDKTKRIALISCSILARLLSFITICRPDQGPYCISTFYSSPSSSIAPVWSPILVFVVLLVVFIVLSKLHYQKRFMIIFGGNIYSSALYWAFDTFQAHELLFLPDYVKGIILFVFWTTLLISLTYSKKGQDRLFMFLLLFQKPMGQVSLSLLYLYLVTIRNLQMNTIMPFFLGQLVFFSTGHQNALASIQYDAGFIGLYSTNYVLSPVYVALNTFGGPILSMRWEHNRLLTMTILLTITTFFTCWFSRHSQAFRVWGPKFLFTSLSNYLCLFFGFIQTLANRK